jgi:hypothetical protein
MLLPLLALLLPAVLCGNAAAGTTPPEPAFDDSFHEESAAECASHENWQSALAEYGAWHGAALARLAAAAAAGGGGGGGGHAAGGTGSVPVVQAAAVDAWGIAAPAAAAAAPPPLPGVSVYRVLPHEARIGWGDMLPGLTNVFLSVRARASATGARRV